MWPDERVVRLVEGEFVPVRVHVRHQAEEFLRLGERYGAHWTPTMLVLDADGTERHRVEGFLPADDLLAQLSLGLARAAFKAGDWAGAERHYASVADTFPQGEAAAESVYWAGVSRYKQSNDAAVLAATARRLAERYAGSAWAKRASVWG